MAELLKNIQSYWDMRAGGFSDASMEERKTEPGAVSYTHLTLPTT